jgi:hypothetical protein
MNQKNPVVDDVAGPNAQGDSPGIPQNIWGTDPPSVYIVSGTMLSLPLKNDGRKLTGFDPLI